MISKGNRDTILSERLNRCIHTSMRVLHNGCKSNMIFVEGSQMVTYVLNSGHVTGTDLSRSLLFTGHEFYLLINFFNRTYYTYEVNETSVKSHDDGLLPLLQKIRESIRF